MLRQPALPCFILCRAERNRLSDPVEIHAVYEETVLEPGDKAHLCSVRKCTVIEVISCPGVVHVILRGHIIIDFALAVDP